LPKSPRLRKTLAAYTVNELGTWFGYVALALGVYEHTGSAIATAGLFVARGFVPALLAPILVAHTERSRRESWLAWLYVVEGLLTLCLAALLWRFWLAGVLVLVAVDGIVAVAATALVRTAATRTMLSEAQAAGRPPTAAAQAPTAGAQAPTEQSPGETAQRQANAWMNVSFMFALAAGPALGGLLVNAIGGPLALVIDAATFLACAPLMLGLGTHVEEGSHDSVRARLLAAWRHIWEVPQLRALLLTEAVAIVFFASVEPVEVIYAKATLGAGAIGFGVLVGAWGVGAAIGALGFARAVRWPLAPMLIGGTLLVGISYLGFAAAPSLGVACVAAVVGGAGNGVQWPSLISAVQQLTPAPLHGRLMSGVGSMNALCPAIGFALGGAAVALSSPRAAMALAGAVASLATLAFLRLPLTGLHSQQAGPAVTGEPGLVTTPR
jgi:MFS family permease